MSDKYVFIRTFGCQMNVHDSARMEEILSASGFQPASVAELADLIILNTCSVREKSREKVLSAIGRYAAVKRPGAIIAVAGCVAQQEGEQLFQLAPAVDLVFSPDHIAKLPVLIEQAREKRRAHTGFVNSDDYQFLQSSGSTGPSALVTIQKGCDNACTYCIVPSVRGRCICRPKAEIVSEIHDLVSKGAKEVTLIGQNVNAYSEPSDNNACATDRVAPCTDDARSPENGFVDLLHAVENVPGLKRLRFTTSHPKDIDPRLADCFGTLGTLCPWLHLPAQSGSTSVLRRMNRRYTREEYVGHLERIRAARPDIAVGTDLIVGFPGETSQEFEQTLSLVEEMQFDYAYSFKFSPRPGTPAEALGDDVDEVEKAGRLKRLQDLQGAITSRRLKRMVGQQVEVLVEGPSRRGLPQLCGRTPGNQVVNIDGGASLAVGDLVKVQITHAGKHSLHGIAATPDSQEDRICSSR